MPLPSGYAHLAGVLWRKRVSSFLHQSLEVRTSPLNETDKTLQVV